MKAMLLAAGVGERMLPITRLVPKPLIPVLGRPLAPQILSRMASEGIEDVVINLHHLPDRLKAVFTHDGAAGLRTLHFSLEEKQLLGTGGGIANAAAQLRGEGTILVRNADFLADVPLASVVESHLRSGCPATIVVVPHRPGYTPVAIDGGHRVLGFGGAPAGRYLFTGYQLIDESVLEMIPARGPSDIVRDVYFALAADRRLNAYVHDGFWWEFGDPRAYLEGSLRLMALAAERRVTLGDFDLVRPLDDAVVALGPGADFGASSVRLAGAVAVGMGAMIGESASLENTVVMPEAWVGPGSRLTRCIVGPGAEIPAGFTAENMLIATDPDPAGQPGQGTERVSGVLVRRFHEAAA